MACDSLKWTGASHLQVNCKWNRIFASSNAKVHGASFPCAMPHSQDALPGNITMKSRPPSSSLRLGQEPYRLLKVNSQVCNQPTLCAGVITQAADRRAQCRS